MSAWIVSKEHIDALVQAARANRSPQYPGDCCDSGMTYYWPEATERLTSRQLMGHDETPFDYDEYIQDRQACHHDVRQDSADRLGQMLWGENHRSVNARYLEDDIEPLYTYSALPGNVEPVTVLKAVACYEYQTCEHDGWEASEAHVFCETLRHKMTTWLPGYDDAPWGIDSRNVFTERSGG